eukprot:1180531-Prorocentrum_minimum.AAC.4
MADTNFVPPPEDSSQSFLIKLVTFMGEDDFENSLDTFLKENASNADSNTYQPEGMFCRVVFTEPGEEQTLGTYEIYQNYLKMVETKFEAFLAVTGLTPEQFQEECVKLKKSDENGGKFLVSAA